MVVLPKKDGKQREHEKYQTFSGEMWILKHLNIFSELIVIYTMPVVHGSKKNYLVESDNLNYVHGTKEESFFRFPLNDMSKALDQPTMLITKNKLNTFQKKYHICKVKF